MAGIKLSDVIQSLHNDDDLRKLAEESTVGAEAGKGTKTQSPDGEMVGETIEDEKHQIQTKLMELAGLTNEGISAAKTPENLNAIAKTPAGEKATATSPAVAEGAAKAAAANEIADVLGDVMGKMKPEQRKEAAKAIVTKIASMNALTLEDTADIKVAEAKFQEYDAAGRIMARAYYDEMGKLAEASVELEKKAAAAAGTEGLLSEKELALIDELTK